MESGTTSVPESTGIPDIPIPADYEPGQTRVPLIFGIATTFCGIATIMCMLRFYVRHRLLHMLGKDDWFLLISLVFTWANASFSMWGTSVGFGRHVYDVVREGINPMPLMYVGAGAPVVYHLSQFFVQVSIITFYIRLGLFLNIKYMRYLQYILIVSSALNNLITTITDLVFMLAGNSESRNFGALWYANTTISLIIDLTIWAVPLRTLWKLKNLPMRRKVALLATFSVGLGSCVSMAIRLVYLGKKETFRAGDESWDRVSLHLMCISETALGVSCAGMATLRPLMVQWGVFSPTSSRSGVSGDAYQRNNITGAASRNSKAVHVTTSMTVSTGRAKDDMFDGPEGVIAGATGRGKYTCTVTNGRGSWEEDEELKGYSYHDFSAQTNTGSRSSPEGSAGKKKTLKWEVGNGDGVNNAKQGDIELAKIDVSSSHNPPPPTHDSKGLRRPANPFSSWGAGNNNTPGVPDHHHATIDPRSESTVSLAAGSSSTSVPLEADIEPERGLNMDGTVAHSPTRSVESSLNNRYT